MATIRLFLSSPGDCKAERLATHKVVEKLNLDPLVGQNFFLQVVAWDWGNGIPLDALSTPQVSVNRSLPKPERCDVFVGIFRQRFGTPLPAHECRTPTGKQYLSGSEYEFHQAWGARRVGAASPTILMYRWQDDSRAADADQLQLSRLNNFFENPPFKNAGSWIGSVTSFTETEIFAEKLEGDLRVYLAERVAGANQQLQPWLVSQSSRMASNAGPRYTAETHVDNNIQKHFDWVMLRPNAVLELDKALAEVWKHLPKDALFSEERASLSDVAATLRAMAGTGEIPNFKNLEITLSEIETKAWQKCDQARKEKPKSNNHQSDDEYRFQRLATDARDAKDIVSEYGCLATNRVLLLTGVAGQGKTHTMVHEIQRALTLGEVAIGLLCQELSGSNDLWNDALQRWEFKHQATAFLDRLESEAAQRNSRALIVFDALNETPSRSRWRVQLAGMINQIRQRPHLVLAISVRTDYLTHTLPSLATGTEAPWIEVEHPGFSGIEQAALIKYFAFYGVKAPTVPPIGEMSNPLYLKLLVTSLKNSNAFTSWLPSWLHVWETWISQLETDAIDALSLEPSRPKAVRRLLDKLVQEMLEIGQPAIERGRANEIAKQTTGTGAAINFLCSAGALIDRLDDDVEIVEFAYERLSDTFIADRLLKTILHGAETLQEREIKINNALAPNGELQALISQPPNYDDMLYTRRAGLLAALSLSVPLLTGRELIHYLPDGLLGNDWDIEHAFVDSLRWRSKPSEFGASAEQLAEYWDACRLWDSNSKELDELIRLCLIPSHPFSISEKLHPQLLAQNTVGERDAFWSIWLVELWEDENSVLRLIVKWAGTQDLSDLDLKLALCVARLLAWLTTSSQNALREDAIRALTRVLVARTEIVDEFLPDFLGVNDAYVVEAVLIAAWGVVISDEDEKASEFIVRNVLNILYLDRKPKWCHLTIRHYGRKIVEVGVKRGWANNLIATGLIPPYGSKLQLSEIPSEDALRSMDTSSGFSSVIWSCLGHDFYWYVMGATSGPSHFLALPLPTSHEPIRKYKPDKPVGLGQKSEEMFDIDLAARFIALNCLELGYTGERFSAFDSNVRSNRIADEKRTERIGKKYQWIGWLTMLGYLADNYQMRPEYGEPIKHYDDPSQISYIKLLDPSRWVHRVDLNSKVTMKSSSANTPKIQWPMPTKAGLEEWANSSHLDLLPTDFLQTHFSLPPEWGSETWMPIAFDGKWNSELALGQWGLDRRFHAEIWWQIMPKIIRASDHATLLDSFNDASTQERLTQIGRIDPPRDYDATLITWPTLLGDFDQGFMDTSGSQWEDWFPVPWMHLFGSCGHPDNAGDQRPANVPWPKLFREWGLELDVQRGLVTRNGQKVFGLASLLSPEDVLFVNLPVFQSLLAEFGYNIAWVFRGERRAFLNYGDLGGGGSHAWIDFHGVGYLGTDGRPQIGWMSRVINNSQVN